jgi:hypothetical protein
MMRGFFRRLFGGGQRWSAPAGGGGFFLDVECDRCAERFHLHINRANDCLQVFDEPGIAWRLQREVVGAQCRAQIQVRIDIAPGGQIVSRDIVHGRFLEADELVPEAD